MNINCNPSSPPGLFRSLRRLTRLFTALGTVLFALSAQAFDKPSYPVIFIHGINSDASMWGEFSSVLGSNGWSSGGVPRWNGSTVTGVVPGDYYTLSFSNNHELTFSKQGAELSKIISAVLAMNPAKNKVILVAHSMGGLAARAYLQSQAGVRYSDRNDVHELITIGTPHQGSWEGQHCHLNDVCSGRKPLSSITAAAYR